LKIVAIAVAFVSLLVSTGELHSQAYPTKPVRFIVSFPAGGAADAMARIIARPLSQVLRQTVVVDNRPGGDGAIAGELAAKSTPDGHTLLVGDSSTSMLGVPTMRKNPPYDPLAHFTPITSLVRYTFFLVVHPGVPAKTVAELIEHARSNPRKLNYATSNISAVLATAQLTSLSKVEMVHVPYKGVALAMPDLLTGRVHVGVFAGTAAVPFVKEGKLRALATLHATRSPLLPDVPTVAEAGMPRLSFPVWAGLFGPAKLPRDIVDRLAREVNGILKRTEVGAELGKHGIEPSGSTPGELAVFLKEQLAAWRSTAREAGLKPE
jgi:tripartite-type tricarboxylate transporter receptor subunit TctC